MSNALLRDRFRQAYRNLNLQPLLDEAAIAQFGIEYGEESIAELENLIDLAAPQHNKIIFAGHRGCGKSTLLATWERRLNEDPEQRFFIVRFSIADVVEQSDVNHVNLLFSIALQIMAQAIEAKVEFSEEQRKRIENWFTERTRTITETPISAEVEAGFDFVFFKGKMKTDSSVRDEIKTKFERSVFDLIQQLDNIASVVELVTQQELFVIIDDLDKLDLSVARNLYYENVNALFGPSFRILYTVPIGAVRDITLLNSLNTAADNQMHFMRVSKLYQRGDSRKKDVLPNPEVVAELTAALHRRIDPDLLEPGIAEQIAVMSGGVLRELVRIANECCQQVMLQLRRDRTLTEFKINQEILQLAIDELRNNIAAPLNQSSYQILVKIYHHHIYDDKDDQERQTFLNLLQWLYVLEYRNGDDWFDVNPLVVDLLNRRGLVTA
ncbi:MAG: ATP-binding protein [Oscillatoriales cyanobacterium]|nr:MAG: ATP-binding protein [Oscillatoriales cyanobacterium]